MPHDESNKKRFRRWPPRVGRSRPRPSGRDDTVSEEGATARSLTPTPAPAPESPEPAGPAYRQTGNKEVKVSFRNRRRRTHIPREAGE
ncbi:hypothetical protein KBTX_00979 [wastewater metagenome]|uniref:Uncharacterized protein n=2 Tax=unclassified sequences TaxID=12908 RepID=A0A5B8R871_9ZZZZ|nr:MULTISPECIES: hypothetical protein [Arhodomonas]QEA04671.1 hypothetical protein KBTEX_00979 [uncultured organism]